MGAKRVVVAAVLVGGILALAGCGSSGDRWDDLPHDAVAGGQTLSEMQAAVNSIPGLVFSEADGGGKPNVKDKTGYRFAITVEPEYEITNGPALVTYLMESAWSVREGFQPNARINISVTAGRGSAFSIQQAAIDGGWRGGVAAPADSDDGYSIVSLSVDDTNGAEDSTNNRERLGEWPGDIPSPPSDLTAVKG